MECDLSYCLIARAGEIIACPDCGASIAQFNQDCYFDYVAGTIKLMGSGVILRGHLLCGRCGGAPTPSGASGGDTDDILKASRLRIFLSTGWRELGGEAV